MPSTLLRPVVALDVDGVLNPDVAGEGTVTRQLSIPAADVPDSPFVRGYGRKDLDLTVHVNPAYGAWITQLREHADVVWATTWEHAANKHLAPLLGIEPLEVAVSVTTHPPRFGHAKNGDSPGWKSEALTALFPGRPLAWVDDSPYWAKTPAPPTAEDLAFFAEVGIDPTEHAAQRWRYPETSLVVAPDPAVGLTVEEMARIDRFVADPTGYTW